MNPKGEYENKKGEYRKWKWKGKTLVNIPLKHQLAAYEFVMVINGAPDINNRPSTSKLGTLKRTDL